MAITSEKDPTAGSLAAGYVAVLTAYANGGFEPEDMSDGGWKEFTRTEAREIARAFQWYANKCIEKKVDSFPDNSGTLEMALNYRADSEKLEQKVTEPAQPQRYEFPRDVSYEDAKKFDDYLMAIIVNRIKPPQGWDRSKDHDDIHRFYDYYHNIVREHEKQEKAARRERQRLEVLDARRVYTDELRETFRKWGRGEK